MFYYVKGKKIRENTRIIIYRACNTTDTSVFTGSRLHLFSSCCVRILANLRKRAAAACNDDDDDDANENRSITA